MKRLPTFVEVVMLVAIALLVVMMATVFVSGAHWLLVLCGGLVILIMTFLLLRYSGDPDRLRARQSERTLTLAAQTLPYMRQGLSEESAQEVCKLLLPATLATSVAITSRETIMGFAGAESQSHEIGSPIRTEATRRALAEGRIQVVTSRAEIGFPADYSSMQAAIVVPLFMNGDALGVLKFYYRSPKKIDATQLAMAQGLGALLEMQLQLAELESQRELATRMSLKALQAQINPHFLFNTINTIAALIRTNPMQARILLREFAVFYRRTLEGSLDNISLEQELMQTLRYLGFEIARFGEDRIILESDIEAGLETLLVPAFIIQPIVENAVGHGMRDDAPLHIWITAYTQSGSAGGAQGGLQGGVQGERIVITIRDDGVGISEDDKAHMLDKDREHAGIALQNVDERLQGFFGRGAGLAVQSEVGVGTTITLTLRTLNSEQ